MSSAEEPKAAHEAPGDEWRARGPNADKDGASPSDGRVGLLSGANMEAIAALSQKLDEFEIRLRARNGEGDDAGLKETLAELEAGLRTFARRRRPAAPLDPFSPPGAAEPFPFKSALLARLDPPAPSSAASSAVPAVGDALLLIDMQNDIAELARKLDNMCQGVAHISSRKSEAVRGVDNETGRADVAASTGAFGNEPPQDSFLALGAALADMTARGDDPKSEDSRRGSSAQLERLARDLQVSIAKIDGPSTIQRLEREIKAIGGKLEAMGQPAIDPAAFAHMQEQTNEIRASLAALAARPLSIDKLERQVALLAELVPKRPAILAPAGPDQEPSLSRSEEIPTLSKEAGGIKVLHKIEAKLDALTRKADAAIARAIDPAHDDALSRHLEATHGRLTARMEAGLAAASAETGALKDLVAALAQKMDAGRESRSADLAVEALEREISKIAERLNGADKSFASLTALEHSISSLFEQLEETRRTAFEAAEAARGPVPGGETGSHGMGRLGARLEHEASVTREIADLRAAREEADRRIHLTLAAVQETVGKVADRLAKLESELGEMRPGQIGPLLSSGLTPIFTPRPPVRRSDAAAKENAAATRDGAAERARNLGEPIERSPIANGPGFDAKTAESTDYLIEPGAGFPHRRDAGGKHEAGAPAIAPYGVEGRADFIAAARRAAQAAQKDVLDAIRAQTDEAAADPDVGRLRQMRNFYGAHKRSIVMGVAALCLAAGAYALARTVAFGSVDDLSPAFLKQFGVGKGAVHGEAAPSARGKPLAARSPIPAPAPVRQASAKIPETAKPLPPDALAPPASGEAPSGGTTLAMKLISGGAPILIGAIRRTDAPAADGTSPAARVQAAAKADRLALAEAGDAAAQFERGIGFSEGRDGPPDLKLAAQWYEKAARQGLAAAQYRLGKLYEKGLGARRDPAQAKALYRAAAEQGNIRAMHDLGVLAAEGVDGRPDYATAALWFGRAAEFGVRDSQFNAAVLLARGLGGPQDLVGAYMWFTILAADGDAEAGVKRDEAGARLTASERAAAKSLAAAFRPRVADQAANESDVAKAGLAAVPAAPRTDSAKEAVSGL
jgi:localization factor PodJL